jgi:PAS domain S-box-containing protein
MSTDDRFQQLLEAAPDAIVIVDASGTIVLVNREAERLFGYARDELLGQPVELLLPERYRGAHVVHRRAFTRSPSTRPMGSGLELRARRKDGVELPVEVSLSPIESPEGRLVASSLRDVSERHRAEAAMRRLAAIVDASSDAIIGKTLDGAVTSWNRSAARLFGYTAAEMVGRPFAPVIPPELREEERLALARIARGEPIEPFETERLTKAGRRVAVSLALSPVYDAAGQVVGASAVARDITERRRIEEEARRANAYLRSAVESVPDAFALYDERDRLILCNSAAQLLFGRRLNGPIEGRSFEELLDAGLATGTFDPGPGGAAALRGRWLAYHRAPSGALELRTVDGRSLRLTERRTAEGGTVSLLADVTDDVAREEELRAARASAEAASAAKTEFLSSMSHELRTPLNAVLGFAQLLQRDKKTPLTERQQERLGHVLKGGEHLLRLIDDVLDLARIEAGRVTMSVEPVGVPEVLAEVTTTLEPMAARGEVSLRVEPLPAGLPLVRADRTRLSQILMNFGSNAIKYGKRGGQAAFRVEARGAALRIAVRDDGIGVPDEHRAKLFEPFQRAGQETGPIEGTGIGLAISRRLAELMGGHVGFESQASGSEFWVDVPIHQEWTAGAPPSAGAVGVEASPLAAPGPRHVIVYIEDNPSNIAFMRELIDDLASVELVTAPTAEIGLELVRSRRPAVVLMDINLPGINGFEATRKLAEWPETRAIPVVALTAAAMPRDARRAAETGFYRYLTKPVKVDELTRVLEELLEPKAGQPA